MSDSHGPVRAPRLLVAGYYGYNNLGDEAILGALLTSVRSTFPVLQCTVVTADPEATRRQHGVDVVRQHDIVGLIAAARASDLVLLGGGGLFHDHFGVDPATVLHPSHWGLSYCAGIAAAAALAWRPLVLWGVGAGPLASAEARHLTALTVERANLVVCRDEASADLLVEVSGVDRTNTMTVAADPALLTTSASPREAERICRLAGIDPEASPLIAVAIRPWTCAGEASHWQADVASALDRIVDETGAHLLMVPFQSSAAAGEPDDVDAARRVVEQMRHRPRVRQLAHVLAPREMRALLERCDLTIAMRLHAMVLSASVGTPMVALVYDPKVEAAMAQLGRQAFTQDLSALDAARLVCQVRQVLAAGGEERARVREASRVLMARAREGVARLLPLLAAPPEPRPASARWTAWLHAVQTEALRREAVTVESCRHQASQIEQCVRDAAHAAARQRVTEEQLVQAERQAAHAAARQRAIEEQLVEAKREAALAAERQAALDQRVAQLEHEAIASLHRHHALDERLADLERASAEVVRQQNGVGEQVAELVRQAARRQRRLQAWHPARLGQIAARASLHVARGVAFRSRWLLKRAWRALPLGVRARVRRALPAPIPLRAAFRFDRYRMARARLFGESLEGLRVPADPALVSVVLPAHNGSRFIRESIDSVLSQTWTHWELIIVDDGSTDETLAIAQAYAARDARVRVVPQDHRRLPATLSHGFQLARGAFLTWTSCDNRMKPDCLERLVAALHAQPSWDMVYANLDMIDEAGQPLRGSLHYEGDQHPPGSEHVRLPRTTNQLNVIANNHVGATFLYRSRVAWLLGDYSRHRFVMEDYDYWMRVNALLTLRHVGLDQSLYEYRFHEESLTSRWVEFDMLRKRERLMVFEDFRLDFYLSPMLWIVSGDAPGLVAQVRRWVRQTGQVLGDDSAVLDHLPPTGVPVVHVHVSADPASAVPAVDPLPAWAVRALVSDARTLPTVVADGWDVCLGIGSPASGEAPRLPEPYRGWATGSIETVCHAIDIRARSAYLADAEQRAQSTEAPARAVSVVIATRCPPPAFARVLRALAQEVVAHADTEVIVVDNHPSDPAVAWVLSGLRGEFDALGFAVRYVACPIPGLSAARNAGLGAARGAVVCYLDDDAVVGAGWLAAMRRAFESDPDLGVVGGHIRLRVPDPRPVPLAKGWETYWSEFLTGYTQLTEVTDWSTFPWGANWAARRRVLLEMGGFRIRYGRVGNNFWGGEELVAASLARRLGYRVAVQPQAEVLHDVDPARFTFEHVRRTIETGQRVYVQASLDEYVPDATSFRTIYRDIWAPSASVDGKQDWWVRKESWYRRVARARLAVAAASTALARRYPRVWPLKR